MTRSQGKTAHNFTKASFFGLAKQIGLSPDEAKEMAYMLIGKDSLTKFTQKELNEVCHEILSRKDALKRSRGRISDRQIYKVKEYERLLGWDNEPKRLAKFIEKDYHVSELRWLTPSQGSNLIDGLKKMYERGYSKEVSV